MREASDFLSRRLGYRFDNDALLEQALTHRSAASRNNERFEFLGDAILGFVIADELYRQYPEASEGELSRLRARLVKRESLAELARGVELGRNLNLGAGELRSGGQARDSILADALEALFGAIYLDSGFVVVSEVIRGLYREKLAGLTKEARQKDPKTRLQEYLQARRSELPSYSIQEISGEQHKQSFVVECVIDGLDLRTVGRGRSRRKAEQAAATSMLDLLQV